MNHAVEALGDFLSSLLVNLGNPLDAFPRVRTWRVEVVGPAHLDRGPAALALVYREGEQALWLYGTHARAGTHGQVDVPTPAGWDGEVPDWARGRRSQILGRIARDRLVRGRVALSGYEPGAAR